MDSGVVIGIIVSVILFILGIIASYLITLRFRGKREIRYQIIDDIPVVSISPEVKGKSEIPSVEDVYQVVLRIWNSGTDFIRVDEFLPSKGFPPSIWIHFEGAKVVGTPEWEAEPDDLKDRVTFTRDTNKENVTLAPFYFSPEDVINLKVLVTQYNGSCTLNGSIAGTKIVLVHERKKPKELIVTALFQALRYGLYHKSQDRFQEALRKELDLHKGKGKATL